MDATKEKDGAEVLFTHKRCFRAFDKAHRYWGSMELSVFPLYLERNIELDRAAAEETARLFATI